MRHSYDSYALRLWPSNTEVLALRPERLLDSAIQSDIFPYMSVKEAAHAAIDTLPNEATLQDAADRLALLAALEKGRQAVKEGRWKSQEDMEKLLPKWLEQ